MTRESYPQWRTFELVKESNSIENIHSRPRLKELAEFDRWMELEQLSLSDFVQFVGIYAPGHNLRTRLGQDVRIGDYYPPGGGPNIPIKLAQLIARVNALNPYERCEQAWEIHVEYEKLHPFTDGNGRSGRMLWHWLMKANPRWAANYGFLRSFYYQTLARQQS